MTLAIIFTSLGAGVVIGSLMDEIEQWMFGMTVAVTRILGLASFVLGLSTMIYLRTP